MSYHTLVVICGNLTIKCDNYSQFRGIKQALPGNPKPLKGLIFVQVLFLYNCLKFANPLNYFTLRSYPFRGRWGFGG